MKKRGRVDRRRIERDVKKLGDAREKLAKLSPGGAPERPIDVESASIVESRALALGCARCEGELKMEDHAAVLGLRRVRARCKTCGATREVWLRIAERLLS
ncbi:MAG: hypothetical protein M3Y87_18475 [Myxococcota bacterium]|nr:hypothetical protein [Myxococcota bacterium]